MKYNNGDLYIGNWKNDKKEVEDKIEYNNMQIYLEEFLKKIKN